MTVSIRPATTADADLIAAYVRALAEHEGAVDKLVATPALIAAALAGGPPAAGALIAEVAGRPAGAALYFHTLSSWTGWRGLYLEDLYVAPEARGHGVGAALLRALARVAVDTGCARFEWAVTDANAAAAAFYRAHGAVALDQRVYRVSGAALVALAEK